MIIKITNKSKNFYSIMGRFFGSRIVEHKTNDRIYDDNEKNWYVFFDDNIPVAFISVVSNVIKNIYSVNDDFLEELLKYIMNDIAIKESIVTKIYSNVYEDCGLIVEPSISYKNFVKIRSGSNG